MTIQDRWPVRALRECPHLRIEIWGTRFCGFSSDGPLARPLLFLRKQFSFCGALFFGPSAPLFLFILYRLGIDNARPVLWDRWVFIGREDVAMSMFGDHSSKHDRHIPRENFASLVCFFPYLCKEQMLRTKGQEILVFGTPHPPLKS